MGRSTKESWLNGPGDLKEADVEDVPVKGETVRVRGLPAAYSNQAQAESVEYKTGQRGEGSAVINVARMEILQFTHGVIEPKFIEQDAQVISQKYGPAFKKVIAKIDELSGLDKEAIENAELRFPVGGAGEVGKNGADPSAGSDGPDLPARAGARAGDAG